MAGDNLLIHWVRRRATPTTVGFTGILLAGLDWFFTGYILLVSHNEGNPVWEVIARQSPLLSYFLYSLLLGSIIIVAVLTTGFLGSIADATLLIGYGLPAVHNVFYFFTGQGLLFQLQPRNGLYRTLTFTVVIPLLCLMSGLFLGLWRVIILSSNS